nr:PREDICTED: protein D2-like [Bemisia tabaci]XP_018905860.1 PREDICTED: protein D2-like [Bemisia tabaci]XP_018905861.1 PREDICTED: protein D2-like [Bemisia tabaci]XP_018905862.1 PREDICTED: protein D2-like [Bemisia tabaci]
MFTLHLLSLCGLMTAMQLKCFSMAIDIGNNCSIEDMKRLLKMHEIIPDLLKDVPNQCLDMELSGKTVILGDRVDYFDTVMKPNKIEWEYEDGGFYSLVMTGLDVPTREVPNSRESQNWVVGNIPGINITAGDTLFRFQPPGVEYGEGTHRIAILIFKQRLPIKFTEMDLGAIRRDSVNRAYFSTEGFSEKYELGPPLAINFYEFEMKM